MHQIRETRRCGRQFIPALIVAAALVAAAAPLLAAGPQFSATFKAADAQPSGDSVHVNFSFSLRVAAPSDLVVEAVKLGNPAASDHAYADFPGGTIHAGGELNGSASVTIPKKIYKKWKAGQPASLFVRTAGDSGSAVWARVDATAAAPIH
jgi:hypothetical protein